MKIILLRHGQSTANQDRIVQGQLDFPLSVTGAEQVALLGARWLANGVRFDTILSSPLQRAHESARILSKCLGGEVKTDPIWMERHWGEAQGKEYGIVRRRIDTLPPEGLFDPLFSTGESVWEIFQRAGLAIHLLIKTPVDRVLVVSHGGLLSTMLKLILGIPLSAAHRHSARILLDNTGFAQLTYDPTEVRWTLEHLNDTYHLCHEG